MAAPITSAGRFCLLAPLGMGVMYSQTGCYGSELKPPNDRNRRPGGRVGTTPAFFRLLQIATPTLIATATIDAPMVMARPIR
jgi:hypothetical protein